MSTFVDPLVGHDVAGRYRVMRLIGEGGMGKVYEVEHLKVGKRFALKRLSARERQKADGLDRFRREAEAVARLRHPNVIDLVDWEVLEDGSPCLITELLRGETLDDRIARLGQLPWEMIAWVSDQTMSALSAAHRAGITHRDLKPPNLFLATDDSGEERVKLLDFGASKLHDASFETTGSHTIGTPAYMSPEQAMNESQRIGPATDVWAMGAILFEMAAGTRAFSASSVPALLYRISRGDPDELAPQRSDAPASFVRLLSEALERDPHKRIASIDELRRRLREALEPCLEGLTRRLPALPEPRAAARSGFLPWAVTLGAAGIAGLGFVVSAYVAREERAAPIATPSVAPPRPDPVPTVAPAAPDAALVQSERATEAPATTDASTAAVRTRPVKTHTTKRGARGASATKDEPRPLDP
jgi:serine/threonine-protein kinase